MAASGTRAADAEDLDILARGAELAAAVRCFGSSAEWAALLTEVLLPWAAGSRRFARLLLQCLRELADLGDNAADRAQAADILRVRLLPFLPPAEAASILAFLK